MHHEWRKILIVVVTMIVMVHDDHEEEGEVKRDTGTATKPDTTSTLNWAMAILLCNASSGAT